MEYSDRVLFLIKPCRYIRYEFSLFCNHAVYSKCIIVETFHNFIWLYMFLYDSL